MSYVSIILDSISAVNTFIRKILTQSISFDIICVLEVVRMNERLKELRKALHLSQKEFATKLGITDGAISKLESGRNSLTEQTISAICHIFNVNYSWLTTGDGDMFTDVPATVLDELCRQYDLDELDRSLITKYLKLTAHDRQVLKDYIRNIINPVDDTQSRIDK